LNVRNTISSESGSEGGPGVSRLILSAPPLRRLTASINFRMMAPCGDVSGYLYAKRNNCVSACALFAKKEGAINAIASVTAALFIKALAHINVLTAVRAVDHYRFGQLDPKLIRPQLKTDRKGPWSKVFFFSSRIQIGLNVQPLETTWR